jgi:aminodeoxyfutalosine synthase
VSATSGFIADIEARLAAGETISRADADRLQGADILTLGGLAETARRARSGDRVTYGRVCVIDAGTAGIDRGAAGEVRLAGRPASAGEARARVTQARALAGDVPLTGFSLADLLQLVGGDHIALADLAAALCADGLEAVAETPLDGLGDTENAIEVVRAVVHGGLGAWRATVDAAEPDARLDLIDRAEAIQRETGAFRALAPLPRRDPIDQPATGYDDVRTVAIARLMSSIPSVQVDWPLYGPKLAQVAIAYGANDIDGIAATETLARGPRRAPRQDIERQIRAAGGEPVERDGRYSPRA